MKGVTEILADFLVDTRYDDLPNDVVLYTKRLVLDILGSALAGSKTLEARMAYSFINELGGEHQSTVIAHGRKNSCVNASFANSIMAHAQELDDTHRFSVTHPGGPVIPAALAVSEREASSGKEFILSIVLGYECTVRIANAIQPSHGKRGFHSMGTCGIFGAATSASKILGLDKEQTLNTLGLAGTQASGIGGSFRGFTDMNLRLNTGIAARNGIVAALLAQKGFLGNKAILESDRGFGTAFSDKIDFKEITKDLARSYKIIETSIKPYSCCRHHHAAIDAVFQIMKTESIDPDKIEEVEIRTYSTAVTRPHRYAPLNILDAQFSYPYIIAVAILEGAVMPWQFTEEKIRDPRIHEMAKKVFVVEDPEMTELYPDKWPAMVTIKMNNDRKYDCRVDLAKGEPENPLTNEELHNKFVSLATTVINEEKIDRIIKMVSKLQELDELGKLTKQLC
jgi:2-methylcitrate dehydratase PrpD